MVFTLHPYPWVRAIALHPGSRARSPHPANSFKQLIAAFEELFDEALGPAPSPPASACRFPQAMSASAANPPRRCRDMAVSVKQKWASCAAIKGHFPVCENTFR